MKEVIYVRRVKALATGYVMLWGRGSSRSHGWAQMPRNEWFALQRDEEVPERYVFSDEEPKPVLVKRPELLKPFEDDSLGEEATWYG